MRRFWSFYGKNRMNFYLACVFVLVVGVLVSNKNTSLAYFTAHDEVVNQHHAAELEIKLFEPEWYASGMEKAKKLQPGMVIEKDPYVYNASDADVYVRMKIEMLELNADGTIKYEEGKEKQITGERYNGILNTIYYLSGNTSEEGSAAAERLVTIADDTYSSNNPSFWYSDGWFYYGTVKAGNDGDVCSLTALAPESSTEKLFDELRIPVLKSEYLKIFDLSGADGTVMQTSNFTIRVIAQAVPAASVPAGTNEVIEEVKELFEKQFGD